MRSSERWGYSAMAEETTSQASFVGGVALALLLVSLLAVVVVLAASGAGPA
jgi:hypothetical protein